MEVNLLLTNPSIITIHLRAEEIWFLLSKK
jgi:hypothetical protein